MNKAIYLIIYSTILYLLTYCSEKEKAVDNRYGRSFNDNRQKLRIPPIEDDWVMVDNSDSILFWTNKKQRLQSKDPHHIYKITKMSNGELTEEIDDYHYEFSDTTSYRLVITNYFDSGNIKHKTFRLVTYFTNKYPPTKSDDITLREVDSLMKTWGMKYDTVYIW